MSGLHNSRRLDAWKPVVITLDPTVGAEIRKIRPCLAISPDEMNRHLQTVIVAPMTTSERAVPMRVGVSFQGRREQMALDHIRAVAHRRLVRKGIRADRSGGFCNSNRDVCA
ncbi:MAG TPA: type II toxin-antitoxin system PemK/MazF family toxin [Candidatus Binatia bacterium]|nr:type II toxin-antitoxin system PemK/MazF family toxin [Candidatus Binatia bacterium]